MPAIAIDENLEIDAGEISFSFSRSGGPGGQNVNKVATKATLTFDLEASESLSEAQKARLRTNLAMRLTKSGLLRISRQSERSQMANRRAAVEAFALILQEALEVPVHRRPTKTPRRTKERRLSNKKHRSRIKEGRGRRKIVEE